MRVRFGCRVLAGLIALSVPVLTAVQGPPAAATPPVFAFLDPGGGETLVGGASYLVSWNVLHEGDARVRATVRWSDGGPAFALFLTRDVFVAGDAGFAWRVPEVNRTGARIQVCAWSVDWSTGCIESGPFNVTATPPYFDLLSPADGSRNVPVIEPWVVEFSPAVDRANVSYQFTPPLPFTTAWSNGDSRLSFFSILPFFCQTLTLAVSVSGLGTKSWSFTTECPGLPPANPVLVDAVLDGPGGQDLLLRWNASSDEGQFGGTIEYRVLRAWEPRGPFEQLSTVVANGSFAYTYRCRGCGHDPAVTNSTFYKVRASNEDLAYADSAMAAKFSKALAGGWNLVSVPVEPSDRSPLAVFQTLPFDIARTYRIDEPDDPWKAFRRGAAGDLSVLRPRDGVWVYVDSPAVWTVAGLIANQHLVSLLPGWNLVGYPTFYEVTRAQSLAPIPGVLAMETFEPSSDPYRIRSVAGTDVLVAGEAYWVLIAPGGGGTWDQY